VASNAVQLGLARFLVSGEAARPVAPLSLAILLASIGLGKASILPGIRLPGRFGSIVASAFV